MVDRQIKTYLKDIKEQDGTFVLNQVSEIERSEERRISGADLVKVIEQLAEKIDSETAEYNALAESIEKREEEYDKLRTIALDHNLIDEDEEEEYSEE